MTKIDENGESETRQHKSHHRVSHAAAHRNNSHPRHLAGGTLRRNANPVKQQPLVSQRSEIHVDPSTSQFVGQHYKTKMCANFLYSPRGCISGNNCSFAHSEVELRRSPDLSKTKLCQLFPLGLCKEGTACKWAHGRKELRSTSDFYKLTLCRYWLSGDCYAGDACRHAHGTHELRNIAGSCILKGEKKELRFAQSTEGRQQLKKKEEDRLSGGVFKVEEGGIRITNVKEQTETRSETTEARSETTETRDGEGRRRETTPQEDDGKSPSSELSPDLYWSSIFENCQSRWFSENYWWSLLPTPNAFWSNLSVYCPRRYKEESSSSPPAPPLSPSNSSSPAEKTWDTPKGTDHTDGFFDWWRRNSNSSDIVPPPRKTSESSWQREDDDDDDLIVQSPPSVTPESSHDENEDTTHSSGLTWKEEMVTWWNSRKDSDEDLGISGKSPKVLQTIAKTIFLPQELFDSLYDQF